MKKLYLHVLSYMYTVILSLLCVVVAYSIIPSTVSAATAQDIKNRYATGQDKVRVLIVPGHDDEYWGTQFGDTRESDVVVAIGQHLFNLLKKDPKFDVTITRTQAGYTQQFLHYFQTERQNIQNFITTQKQEAQKKLENGEVKKIEGVPHNDAQPEVAIRLYGINKWANENDIDLVLHLHINDTPLRTYGQAGPYEGFTIYIPEKQYANAETSRYIGLSLFSELSKIMNISTYPPEAAGVVEDQDLIAVGSWNTLKAASLLLEYGYIYEAQYLDVDMRELVATDMAHRTYLGLYSFFGKTQKQVSVYDTSLLPHVWKRDVKYGTQHNADVVALQAALRSLGLYPAAGKTFLECPVSGNFGPCTKKAIQAFQKKYNISQTGNLGPLTRAKLNSLFSR